MNDKLVAEVFVNEQDYKMTISPGMKLRRAREAAKLDRLMVAKHLYLTEQVIAALEEDDYEKLPGLTFVRGYLRSYAAFVNESPHEIIEAFNGLGLPDKPAANIRVTLYKENPGNIERYIRPITYGIVAVLVMLLLVWWHSQSSSHGNIVAPINASAPPATQASLPTNPQASMPTNVPAGTSDAAVTTINSNASSRTSSDIPPATTTPAASNSALSGNARVMNEAATQAATTANTTKPDAAVNPSVVESNKPVVQHKKMTTEEAVVPAENADALNGATDNKPEDTVPKAKKNKKPNVILNPPFE